MTNLTRRWDNDPRDDREHHHGPGDYLALLREIRDTQHYIIHRLNRMEHHMSQQLDAIATELSTVADELEAEITDLSNKVEDPAQVDKLQQIADRLRGIAEPSTPDQPPADNGGDVTPPVDPGTDVPPATV